MLVFPNVAYFFLVYLYGLWSLQAMLVLHLFIYIYILCKFIYSQINNLFLYLSSAMNVSLPHVSLKIT